MSGPNVAEGAVGSTICKAQLSDLNIFQSARDVDTLDILTKRSPASVKRDLQGVSRKCVGRVQTFWEGRSLSYMASPSSIWSAQLDPISTWSLTKGQADLALLIYITSSSSKKSLNTKSRKLRSYYRHCCGAPRGFVRRSAIRPQELREVQGLPLPPTSFLPCRVRLSGGRREAYFLLLGAEKKYVLYQRRRNPPFEAIWQFRRVRARAGSSPGATLVFFWKLGFLSIHVNTCQTPLPLSSSSVKLTFSFVKSDQSLPILKIQGVFLLLLLLSDYIVNPIKKS